MQYKRVYFQNFVLCGNCNGEGCRVCNSTGVTPWYEYKRIRPDRDEIATGATYRAGIKELVSCNN